MVLCCFFCGVLIVGPDVFEELEDLVGLLGFVVWYG